MLESLKEGQTKGKQALHDVLSHGTRTNLQHLCIRDHRHAKEER